jgi:aminoglycoside phosphotransferase (APT) family kinase protein
LPTLDPPFGVIPTTPDELTRTWLATILTRYGFSAAVEAIEFRLPSASSLSSEILRVIPRFQDETTGVTPALLWKRSADDQRRREAFERGYAAEVEFYREIASRIDVSVPRCLAAAYEQETGAHVLLLEDLAPSTPGDFIQGISSDEAKLTLREFARLHAARWTDVAAPQGSTGNLVGHQVFVEQHAALSAPYLTEHVDNRAPERTRRYADEEAEHLAVLAAGPQTFIHGDAHPANVIFPHSSTARPHLVDWQRSRVDAPLRDVARFLILALSTEERRAHEQALLSNYLDQLRANGSSYDAPNAARDYRIASTLEWGWAVAFVRHESIWDRDTRAVMPMLVKRIAAAFDDVTLERDRA